MTRPVTITTENYNYLNWLTPHSWQWARLWGDPANLIYKSVSRYGWHNPPFLVYALLNLPYILHAEFVLQPLWTYPRVVLDWSHDFLYNCLPLPAEAVQDSVTKPQSFLWPPWWLTNLPKSNRGLLLSLVVRTSWRCPPRAEVPNGQQELALRQTEYCNLTVKETLPRNTRVLSIQTLYVFEWKSCKWCSPHQLDMVHRPIARI